MAGGRGLPHVRGAPCHPQTQGKIERWHQTLKNRILLENYYLPGDLEAQIARFVQHYITDAITKAYETSTPADVYFGRGQTILRERESIKRDTIADRPLSSSSLIRGKSVDLVWPLSATARVPSGPVGRRNRRPLAARQSRTYGGTFGRCRCR
jgi:Integrase core domain